MSEEDTSKNKDAAVDLAGMLGMGGILDGVSNILGKLSDLAEKGQQLQAAQGDKSNGEEARGKQLTGSYGFSVKFAGAGKGDGLNVEPLQSGPRATATPKPANTSTRLREPHVEVFDEGDHVLVVAEMPGVSSDDVRLTFVEKNLTINGQTKSAEFKKTVELPDCFSPEHVAISANNGVVEIKLTKAQSQA